MLKYDIPTFSAITPPKTENFMNSVPRANFSSPPRHPRAREDPADCQNMVDILIK